MTELSGRVDEVLLAVRRKVILRLRAFRRSAQDDTALAAFARRVRTGITALTVGHDLAALGSGRLLDRFFALLELGGEGGLARLLGDGRARLNSVSRGRARRRGQVGQL